MIGLFKKIELYFGKNYFCIVSWAPSRDSDPEIAALFHSV